MDYVPNTINICVKSNGYRDLGIHLSKMIVFSYLTNFLLIILCFCSLSLFVGKMKKILITDQIFQIEYKS